MCSKISVWRTIQDFHVLRFIFKIIFEMKYFHRNYFFLLNASALNHSTVVTNVYHLTFSHSIFTEMEVDDTAEKSGFAENIGLRLNSPGRNFNKELLPVSYTHLDVYKRQVFIQDLISSKKREELVTFASKK